MLRFFVPCLLVAVLFLPTSCGTDRYDPASTLDESGRAAFVRSVIPYVGRLAPRATYETRFEARFEEAYRELASYHSLDAFWIDESSGRHYFLISRPAPSMTVKRVATGGFIVPGDTTDQGYAEVFRTWKMPPDELSEKGRKLFVIMIEGGDLTRYYPENSGKEEFIEFPNSETRYDTSLRRWISSRQTFSDEF